MRSRIYTTLLALAIAAPVMAQFTVRVPRRQVAGAGSPLPIGRVKITIETAGAGGDITVASGADTTGAVAFPAGVTDAALGLPAGSADRLTITPLGGGTFRLDITRKRRFSTPGDFCGMSDLADPALENQDYTITVTGRTVTSYRLSSYQASALATDALTGVDCTMATRLVSTSPAIWQAAPPGTNKGRHPIEVVLVLDRSGSMSGNSGQAGFTKLQALKEATHTFITTWKAEPPPVAGADISTDKLGLLFYESAVDLPGTACGNALVARGPGGGVHPWDAIDAKVTACNQAGNTAMGPAVQQSITLLNSPEDKAVLLMTDGLQNVPPNIATGVAPDFITSVGAVQLRGTGIAMQTVALGVGGSVDLTLLNRIASQTSGGGAAVWERGETIAQFVDRLVGILKGNSLSLVTRFAGNASAGAAASSTVELDASIRRVIFLLYHQSPASLIVNSPAGGQFTQLAIIGRGPNWTEYMLDIPAGSHGLWTTNVSGRGGPFVLSTYAYEGKLHSRPESVDRDPGTGKPARFLVDLGFEGKPLTGLAAGVKLEIARPGEALGNIMHDIQVPADVLNAGGGPDPNSPYANKIQNLIDQHKLADRLAPKALPNMLNVTERGNGLYEVTFNDTTVPGRYQFRFVLDWDDPRTGKIHREETVERIVRVIPDPTASQVSVTPNPSGGWLLSVTPMGAGGFYLGPGYASSINVQVANGTMATLTDPRQTGVYTATITTSGNAQPDVKVIVDGVDISPKAPVPGPPLGIAWWIWLLILLLIILIIWWIRKK